MKDLTGEMLRRACADDAVDAGIRIAAGLEPLGGPGAPVKPAIYPGRVYQEDRRWWGSGDDRTEVRAVVIDNAPSQANRCEAALEQLRAELGLPELILDLGGIDTLPPHLPRELSSFRFPHRHADAYLRDAVHVGDPFPKTAVGRAIFAATADRPLALLEWFPQSLLYGFWQSHLGNKRSQAKLARAWTSEIVGYRPATTETRSHAVKGDPLNLSIDESASFNSEDLLDESWTFQGGVKTGKKGEKLSEIGHGQALARTEESALAGVSFGAVEQQSTVSFAALRRIHVGSADENAAARALLVALGLVAHVGAFGRPFSLRSGADLRPVATDWTWLGMSQDDALAPLNRADAAALFSDCAGAAESVGLPVGSRWASDPLRLEPNEALVKAITATWPLEA